MRKFVPSIGIILALSTIPFSAQEEPRPITEAIKGSVVFLYGGFLDDGEPQTAFGTAFFVELPDERLGPGKVFCYLVTNKHVLQPKRKDGSLAILETLRLRINRRISESEVRFQFVQIPLPNTDGPLRWYFHQEPHVDLAVLPVCFDQDEYEHARIPTDLFVTDNILRSKQVNENDDFLFPTLLLQYAGYERNYPLIRHGKISLLTEEKIPIGREDPSANRSLYLVEATAFPGNSGSPVFLKLGIRESPTGGGIEFGRAYYLLGVLEVFFPQQTQIAIGSAETTINLNSGIAGVIPARYLRELLEQEELTILRETTVAEQESAGEEY
ncbi:serine protease [Acidobacteriia bacterium AH_259_A11_L15]|nr:serine protease [Acidobacteriia bacterium AH_259_A11_L15]